MTKRSSQRSRQRKKSRPRSPSGADAQTTALAVPPHDPPATRPNVSQQSDGTTLITAKWDDTFQKILGVKTPALAKQLITQITNLQRWNVRSGVEDGIDTAISLILEMEPRTPAEAMLAVQLLGVHQAATHYLFQAIAPGQTPEGVDAHTTRSARLMRLFGEQLDAMAKLKGTTSHQKVIVEHVHVYKGGQAIVGAVTPAGPRREGVGGGCDAPKD